MKKMFVFLLALLALLALPLGCDIAMGDTVSVTLEWTAPGDDGGVGTCECYELRWSTDSTALVEGFTGGVPGCNVFDPLPAGSTESHTVAGLESETFYFFAVKAVDEAGNWSPLSNVLRVLTPDSEAPDRIADLRERS